MSVATPTEILSRWTHRVPGMEQSSAEFYGGIESAIGLENLADVKCERVNLSEGGILSAKREYLQVRRKEHVFFICASPYGRGFFISWWLGEVRSGLFAALVDLPFVGWLFRFLAAVAARRYQITEFVVLELGGKRGGGIRDNAIIAARCRALFHRRGMAQ